MVIAPILTGMACILSVSNKVLQKLTINKFNTYKKQYKKTQQTIEIFDNQYGKLLHDNVIDSNEYEIFCKISTKVLDETENESFL